MAHTSARTWLATRTQLAFPVVRRATSIAIQRTVPDPCQQPGSNNSDISINKNFKITERVNAQFRAEALNAFNTPQFGNPSATYVVGTPSTVGATPVAATGSSQTLGNVTTQINYNRIIQLGGRISF